MDDHNVQLKNLMMTMAFFVEKAEVGAEYDHLKEECLKFISHLLTAVEEDDYV